MFKWLNRFAKIPQDKLLHFIFGLIIAQLVAMVYIHFVQDHRYIAYINGFCVGAMCGFIKEFIDKQDVNNRFDPEDWLATIIGSIFGITILLIGYC